MFGQKPDRLIKKDGNLVAVPTRIAKEYLAGTWLSHASMVYEGDENRVFRVFESTVNIPSVGRANFHIDECLWDKPDERNHRNQIRFEYVTPDDGSENGGKIIAEMHLSRIDEDTFDLQHRYVHSEYGRRTGIGTALYHQVENWLQQLAEARHRDVMLGLLAAQEDLIKWLRKEKFSIKIEQRPVLNDVLNHPDRFTFDHPSYHPKFAEETWIFPKGAVGRHPSDSILLRFQKQIPSGTPSRDVDEVMKHFVPSWDAVGEGR